MFGERISSALNKDQLIDWLEQVLQPVEPSRRFLRRLRARLVTYQGGRLPSGWMLVVAGGLILVIAVVLLGLMLRLFLGLLNMLGFDREQRQRPKEDIRPTAT